MSTDPTKKKDEHVSTSQALDDEQRVKVLSPGMLVAKRFFRNKLAVAGLVILVAMFVFSFVGGMISPYGESQVFRKTDHVWKDYAGATYNKAYIFETVDGTEFPAAGQQKFILATNKGDASFEADGVTYALENKGEEYWAIYSAEPVATVLTLKGKSTYKESGSVTVTDEIKEGYEAAVENDEDTFEVDGTTYSIEKSGRENVITISGDRTCSCRGGSKQSGCLRHILVFGTACCGNRSGTDHKGGLQFPVCGNPGRSNLVFRRQFRSYRKPDFFRRNDQRAVLIQQRRYPGVPGNSWNHGVPDEPCWRICRIRTLGKQAHQNKSGRRACYDFTWRSDFY